MASERHENPNLRRIEVELVGGLGNQLFGYYFGKYVGLTRQMGLSFVYTRGAVVHAAGLSTITSFDLKEPIRTRLQTDWDFITRRELVFRFLSIIGFSDKTISRLSRVHWSRAVGVDANSANISGGQLVKGYFQSSRYFEFVSSRVGYQPLTLKHPSPWFDSMLGKVTMLRPVIFHIRRGDYNDPVNKEIGLLSEAYFLNALQAIKGNPELTNRQIWVFSDDINQVRSKFDNLSNFIDVWVQPPPDSDSAESLMLMARGSAIVISNSTFSWWAATLHDKSMVIAPTKWFKSLEDPIGLVPSSWHRVQSEWE